MRVRTRLFNLLLHGFTTVLVVAVALVVGSGTASAAGAAQDQIAPTPAIAAGGGVSLTTLVWVLAGFCLLVVGLIAASTSGRRSVAGVAVADGSGLSTSGPDQPELNEVIFPI